jgi:hypothetical protein
MDSLINYIVEDGENLSETIDEKAELLKAEGFDEENNVQLKAALAELKLKAQAQNKSVNDTEKKSAAQIKVVSKTKSLLQRLRDAARGAFQDDPKKLKQFKVDEAIPRGPGKLTALIEYLIPLVDEEKVILGKNGFLQADIDNLKAAPANVEAAGNARKKNVKAQKSATMVRNDAAEVVKNLVRKIRRFTKARFAERPEILVLFEPLPKGKSGSSVSGEEETPVATPDAVKK